MHSDPLTLQKVFSQQVSGLNEAWRGQGLPPLTEVKQRKEEVVLVSKWGPGIGPVHSEQCAHQVRGRAALGLVFPQPREGSQDGQDFSLTEVLSRNSQPYLLQANRPHLSARGLR